VSGSVLTPGLDVVVVAGSAGALPLYGTLFERLDRTLPVPVLVLQHRRPGSELLLGILQRRTRMEVRGLPSRGRLDAGALYLCPPDAQAVFTGRWEVAGHPLPDEQRPTADRLLESAAAVHGPRVLAVVLTGRLQDGTAGVRAVKAAGGRVIAQDPRTATQPSMPTSALATGCVDACLPPRSIGDAIGAFARVPGAAALFATRPAPWAWPVGSQPLAAEARRSG
jgi:two-component system chemotaxis response regulator CheB